MYSNTCYTVSIINFIASCGIKPTNRIVGGSEAGPFSLPWQVALVLRGTNRFNCGGTLISDRHVLTAAHCGTSYDVMVGEHSLSGSSDGTRHTVCRAVKHPDYKIPDGRINNDYAIFTLTQPVTIGTRANYACLPSSDLGGSFLDDKNMTVSGWGQLGSGQSGPDRLYTVNLPGVTNAECSSLNMPIATNPIPITDRMLCAGRTGGSSPVGACFGDSGGKINKFYNPLINNIALNAFKF